MKEFYGIDAHFSGRPYISRICIPQLAVISDETDIFKLLPNSEIRSYGFHFVHYLLLEHEFIENIVLRFGGNLNSVKITRVISCKLAEYLSSFQILLDK